MPFIMESAWSFRDGVLLLGVMLVTVSVLMRIRKRKMTQRKDKPLTPDEHVEKVKQAKGVRADLEGLMVEIEQLAKRLGTQLDNKSARVEALIEEADRRIETLRQLRPPTMSSDTAKEPNVSPDKPRASPPPALPPADEGPPDPLASSIYALADAGHDPVHIARQLNQDVGKVELILALRQA